MNQWDVCSEGVEYTWFSALLVQQQNDSEEVLVG